MNDVAPKAETCKCAISCGQSANNALWIFLPGFGFLPLLMTLIGVIIAAIFMIPVLCCDYEIFLKTFGDIFAITAAPFSYEYSAKDNSNGDDKGCGCTCYTYGVLAASQFLSCIMHGVLALLCLLLTFGTGIRFAMAHMKLIELKLQPGSWDIHEKY